MFLQKIYKEWRLLFWAVLFLITAQCFLCKKALVPFPFFILYVWTKAPQKQPIDVILLKTPTGYFNTNKLSGRDQERLLNQVKAIYQIFW